MTTLENVSVEQLRRIISLKEQIEDLSNQLAGILGNGAAGPEVAQGKRKMSAAARARIAAAQKARWAKVKAASGTAAPKKRRKTNAAWRAKLAAAARARWAKAKAAGKTTL